MADIYPGGQRSTPWKSKKERLAKLAEPKRYLYAPQDDPNFRREVPKLPTNYKPTKRLMNLSKPKYVNPKKSDQMAATDPLTQSITRVSRSALIYKPTRRILELAQPK